MTRKRLLLLIFFPFFAFTHGNNNSEPLIISLPVMEEKKTPLFLEFFIKEAHLSPNYYQKFQETFRKEVENHDALSLDNHREKCAKIISVYLDKDSVNLTLQTKNHKKIYSHPPLPLLGKISKDILRIDQMLQFIEYSIYGEEHFGNSKINYSFQEKSPNYKKEGKPQTSELFLIDWDGNHPTQITHGETYAICPVFAQSKAKDPQGITFFYVDYITGQPKIYFGAKNQRGVPWIHLRGNQLLPTFSKKNRLLAFISDASGHADLFIQQYDQDMRPLGKPLQVYTCTNGVQASPCFSPDGKRIAFVSDKNQQPQIFLLTVPSFTKRSLPTVEQLMHSGGSRTSPAWSPDGQRLAYSLMVNGTRQIAIYDFEQKKEQVMTGGTTHKENPSWAPDSRHLVYNTVSPLSSELFVLDSKSLRERQITRGPGKKRFPCWGE